MSNEEMIASVIVGELRPWLERIKQLETQVIETRAELRLVKELTFNNYRDDKHTPLIFSGAGDARARSLS